MNDKVSIIIPCYNVEKYISKCIDSIICQTYNNLEIICINDGSVDNTTQILEKYAQSDGRINLINQSNQGLSYSRNLGIKNASGEYIMFVDSDDWLEINCIDFLMTQQTDYDIICFSYFRDFKNLTLPKKLGIEGVFSATSIQRMILGPIQKEIKNVENLDALATVWGKLYRAIKIKNKNFVDIKEIGTWEDGLFNFEVLENCNKVLVLDKPFYHYRKDNDQSFTSQSKVDLYKKWIIKFEILSNLINAKNAEYHSALRNRIGISVLGLILTEVGGKRSVNEKFENIRAVLNNTLYKHALTQLDMSLLPFRWKIFYGLAKRSSALGIYMFAKGIRLVQKVKNFKII